MMSVAKCPMQNYSPRTGCPTPYSIVPKALGRTEEDQVPNLVGLMDGYFNKGGHHGELNVFDREPPRSAMEHPEL